MLLLSFVTLKRCGHAAFAGLCKGRWAAQRQPKGTDAGAYEKRGHRGRKEIHNEGRELIKTSPGKDVLLF